MVYVFWEKSTITYVFREQECFLPFLDTSTLYYYELDEILNFSLIFVILRKFLNHHFVKDSYTNYTKQTYLMIWERRYIEFVLKWHDYF